MPKKECLPGKNSFVSPGEDMSDPLNAPPPYPRREESQYTQPEEEGHSRALLTPKGEPGMGRRLQYPQHLRHFCHFVRHRPDRMPQSEHPLG